MTEQESLLEFPCRFPIKAMGRNQDGFETLVTEIVSRHADLCEGEAVRASASSQGTFLSVTVTIEARSREQLDDIYQDLSDNERVLMAI